MRAIMTLLVLLAWLPTASAQALWQGSEYGMSLDQVQALFPDAAPPDVPGELTGGVVEGLRGKTVDIAGRRFTPMFFFKGSQLSQVNLRLASEGNAAGAALAFDDLFQVLRVKYGAELAREERAVGGMRSREATWLSGKTDISLNYYAFSGSDPALVVVYRLRLSSEANKL